MQIHIYENAAQVGQAAATLIAAQVLAKPASVLGLATGSTPIPTYQELIRLCKAGVLDFSQAQSFNLDEYCALPVGHEQSYHSFMKAQLFDHINIDKYRTYVPNGLATDWKTECDNYDKLIRALGGIDLQLLGIGFNGHIGFNEPAAHFTTNSYCVKLSEQTLHDNRRFFDKNAVMPTHALTMGIASIMQAQHIVLVATGLGKADAVRRMIEGPVDPMVPASILQMHRHATILLDADAASQLKK